MRQTSRLFFFTAVLLSLLTISLAAQADGVISSDFVFQMNNSVFAAPEFDFAASLSGTETISLPDTVFQSDAPVNVRGISGAVSYSLEPATKNIALGADIALVSKSVQAALMIREISIDAVVEKIVDGILIRARVQGSCSNIPLSLGAGQASVVGVIKTGVDDTGLPSLAIPSFEVRWGADAWSIGDFTCTLGDGLRDRVISGLKGYLANPAVFNPSLQAMLAPRIAQAQQSLRAAFLKPKTIALDFKGISMNLQPRAIIGLNADGFQVLGLAQIRFPSAIVNEEDSVVTVLTPPPAQKGFALFVPEGLVTALNKMAYKTGLYTYRKRGQEISGFRDLLSNFFEEFFVWPELMYFSGRAEFLFDFYAGQAPALSRLTDGADGSVSGNISGPLEVALWAPLRTAYVRMMNFHAPLASTYRLSLSDVAGGAQLNVGFTQGSLKLTGAYDGAYARYLHNSAIDLSTIQSSLAKAMSPASVQMVISPLPLTSALSLTPNRLGRNSGWLEIDLK